MSVTSRDHYRSPSDPTLIKHCRVVENALSIIENQTSRHFWMKSYSIVITLILTNIWGKGSSAYNKILRVYSFVSISWWQSIWFLFEQEYIVRYNNHTSIEMGCGAPTRDCDCMFRTGRSPADLAGIVTLPWSTSVVGSCFLMTGSILDRNRTGGAVITSLFSIIRPKVGTWSALCCSCWKTKIHKKHSQSFLWKS